MWCAHVDAKNCTKFLVQRRDGTFSRCRLYVTKETLATDGCIASNERRTCSERSDIDITGQNGVAGAATSAENTPKATTLSPPPFTIGRLSPPAPRASAAPASELRAGPPPPETLHTSAPVPSRHSDISPPSTPPLKAEPAGSTIRAKDPAPLFMVGTGEGLFWGGLILGISCAGATLLLHFYREKRSKEKPRRKGRSTARRGPETYNCLLRHGAEDGMSMLSSNLSEGSDMSSLVSALPAKDRGRQGARRAGGRAKSWHPCAVIEEDSPKQPPTPVLDHFDERSFEKQRSRCSNGTANGKSGRSRSTLGLTSSNGTGNSKSGRSRSTLGLTTL